MKRRNFLAATALFSPLLSLFSGDAWAKKKSSGSSTKSSSKKSGKSSSKSGKSSRRGRGKNAQRNPDGPVAHTADAPVIEKPPQGSSASRLPPVKAQEPPAEWRNYEIVTTVILKKPGHQRLWLPLPLNQDSLFQRTLGHHWNDNADQASIRRLPDGTLEAFYAEWQEGTDAKLQLITTITTADRHFDVTRRTIAPEREDILRRNLQASTLIPNDGLAHQMGERIVGRIKDPVAQAKAIYDWVVDNAIYDEILPNCGAGDVKAMLAQGRYSGRSADISGLFVALCRAIGIPARCVYGLRVGPSRLLRSLGLTDSNATHAQHVRAEFYVPGYGWIPVDPSDVRRAIVREGLPERDSRFASLRKVLFGVWEMNWIIYNVGADLTLPGTRDTLPFFLYPQLEGGSDGLQYAISARRVEL